MNCVRCGCSNIQLTTAIKIIVTNKMYKSNDLSQFNIQMKVSLTKRLYMIWWLMVDVKRKWNISPKAMNILLSGFNRIKESNIISVLILISTLNSLFHRKFVRGHLFIQQKMRWKIKRCTVNNIIWMQIRWCGDDAVTSYHMQSDPFQIQLFGYEF